MLIRSAALGAALFLSLASGTPAGGDRTDGECPEGETCSPDTPDGLYFGGSALGDAVLDTIVPPQRTAVGGTQTLAIFRDEDGREEFVGFDAVAAGPSFQVSAVAENRVGVRGLQAGADYLRLVDPEDGALYDRVEIETGAVISAAIVPLDLDLVGDEELYAADRPEVVYAAGRERARFVVALFDGDGARLVDESLTLELGDGFQRDLGQWDRFEQTQAFAPGTFVVEATTGEGITEMLDVTFVERADAVKWVPGHAASERESPDKGLVNGRTQRYCFRAEHTGRPMIGETFVYSVNGPVKIEGTPGTCVNLEGTGTGTAMLTVLAGDGTLTVPIEVRAAKR